VQGLHDRLLGTPLHWTDGDIAYAVNFASALRPSESDRNENKNRKQPKGLPIHGRASFTATDMPQYQVNENDIFVRLTGRESRNSTHEEYQI
jgi:hypothetical protein